MTTQEATIPARILKNRSERRNDSTQRCTGARTPGSAAAARPAGPLEGGDALRAGGGLLGLGGVVLGGCAIGVESLPSRGGSDKRRRGPGEVAAEMARRR